jgi:hypothetical protein
LSRCRTIGCGGCPASLGGVDSHREQAELFNLHQGRAAICDIHHTGDNFAGTTARFVRKLRHIKRET